MKKKLPLSAEKLKEVLSKFKTPFYIYDEKGIRNTARKFNSSFSWVPGGFMNYFSVKACPNPFILEILKEEGFGVDCSSLSELLLSEKIGFKGKEIIFSSNNTPFEEFKKASELVAIINFDDITHLDFLGEIPFPETVCFRYNPGSLRVGNNIMGNPSDSKFGLTKDQLFEAYEISIERGAKILGLHTMIVSNELSVDYFIETAKQIFELVAELSGKGIKISFVNFGGGIGIPYKPDEEEFDLNSFSSMVEEEYKKIISKKGIPDFKIMMECGRAITGPHGYLISKVRHVMKKYKDYVGLDASMGDLMRPALYGAYHHIEVLGKEEKFLVKKYDVVGSLCENNDKFAIDRNLQEVEKGDIFVIYDVGAHGHAMGFNYNGKLRPSELLFKESGEVKMIRRPEGMEDYFSTLDFSEF